MVTDIKIEIFLYTSNSFELNFLFGCSIGEYNTISNIETNDINTQIPNGIYFAYLTITNPNANKMVDEQKHAI